jgi:hypothetical protein
VQRAKKQLLLTKGIGIFSSHYSFCVHLRALVIVLEFDHVPPPHCPRHCHRHPPWCRPHLIVLFLVFVLVLSSLCPRPFPHLFLVLFLALIYRLLLHPVLDLVLVFDYPSRRPCSRLNPVLDFHLVLVVDLVLVLTSNQP